MLHLKQSIRYTGLALEASCISEALRQRKQQESQQWERWKAVAAAASLSNLLQQSDEQRAAEQLLGESIASSSLSRQNWKSHVMDALSAYKVNYPSHNRSLNTDNHVVVK